MLVCRETTERHIRMIGVTPEDKVKARLFVPVRCRVGVSSRDNGACLNAHKGIESSSERLRMSY